MRRTFFILTLLFSQSVWALPSSIEIWFLSRPKVVHLFELLNKDRNINFAKEQLVQVDLSNCTPMGDGCFHPQLGFIDKTEMKMPDDKKGTDKKDKEGEATKPAEGPKTFNATDVQLVTCDKEYYFDMYCGKAKPESNKLAGVELWIDTSSSFRGVDYSEDQTYCHRRSFVSRVQELCGRDNIHVSVFNTSKKEMGDIASTCMSYGLNDVNRFIDWIKGSNAKKLIVVTDIDELTVELDDFLQSVGAKIVGADTDTIRAADLPDMIDKVAKMCEEVKKK